MYPDARSVKRLRSTFIFALSMFSFCASELFSDSWDCHKGAHSYSGLDPVHLQWIPHWYHGQLAVPGRNYEGWKYDNSLYCMSIAWTHILLLVAFENLIYTLFGLYVWEIAQTFTVEWSILVTRTRPFKWPMVRNFHPASALPSRSSRYSFRVHAYSLLNLD